MDTEKVIYERFRAQHRARVKALWRDEFRQMFREKETDLDPTLEAILDYFRVGDLEGKLFVVETQPWKEYTLARRRLNAPEPLELLHDERFGTLREARIRVFDLRIAELLA